MEVGSGDLAGVPHLRDGLPRLYLLARLGQEPAAVGVEGSDAPVVLHLDILAVGGAFPNIIHHPVGKGADGVPVGGGQVHAVVELLPALNGVLPPSEGRGDHRHHRGGGLLQINGNFLQGGVVRSHEAGIGPFLMGPPPQTLGPSPAAPAG